MKTAGHVQWITDLKGELFRFMSGLADRESIGRFRPCLEGSTPEGRDLQLGFSCLALKTYYMTGLWDELPAAHRAAWIAYIQSFQVSDDRKRYRGAFVDPAAATYLEDQTPRYRRWGEKILRPKSLTKTERFIIAETKQALATLAQVGEASLQPYRDFPSADPDIRNHLLRLR